MSKTTQEEWETHFWFDYLDNQIKVYTNIPKHITAMTRIWGKPHESTGYGVSWTLPGDTIKFPRPKQKRSKAQINAAQQSLAKARTKKPNHS